MIRHEHAGRPARDDADDATLVRNVAAGSSAALGQLFRRHRDAVYRLAYRITGTTQDADDVLQDVFVGLRRALERYDERGRFGAWLLKVAARTAQLRVRRRGSAAFEALDLVEPTGSSGAADGRAVDRIAVRDALARMPASQRVVFLLKEVEGYQHREIAELLDISVASSRVRLHRAWRFLDEQVGGP